MSHKLLLSFTTRQCLINSLKLNSKYLRNFPDFTEVLVRNSSSSNAAKKKTASSVYRTMNIFDRKAKILQRERSARRDDYYLAEYIREEVGWRTADRVLDIKRIFKNAVELGAGRGYVSRHLLPDSVEKVTLCDTSQTHLDKALIGDGVKFDKIVMDEERINEDSIQFPEDTVDLVVSSLCLHWVNNLPGCFDRIMTMLKPDGAMLASVFGGDTLMELRQALQLADSERLGGMAPHVSPFVRAQDIAGLMTASGYTLQTVDVDTITVWYPSAWHVMHDLRSLGEGNAAFNRPLRLSRDVQFAAAAIYEEMYGKDIPEQNCRGVPVTFEIVNFLGWKPSPDQPQPLPRGSGQMSLKDLHRVDEIAKEAGVTPVIITDDGKK